MNENNQTPEAPLASPEATMVDSPTVTPIPPTHETAKKNLHERLKETAQVASKAKSKIPTGNRIEQFLKASEQSDIKKKRGRPKKYPTLEDYIASESKGTSEDIVAEEPQPEVKSVYEAGTTDMISPMINLIASPIIAKKMHRNKKDISYTKDQLVELSKVQPASDLMKPSWLNYAILAGSLLVINVMQAERIDIDQKEADEVKRNFTTSQNAWVKTGVDSEGNDIMQQNTTNHI